MNKQRQYQRLFILLIISVLPITSLAQKPHFRKFTTADGLIQGTVRALVQDSIGRIWIGTSEGISIYDGQSFENISSRDGLKNEIVNCFFETHPGKMLIGTNGAGVTLSIHPQGRPDTLIRTISGKKFICQDSVNKAIRDSHGNIWFCTDGGATSWELKNNDNVSIHNYNKMKGLIGRLVTDIVNGPGGRIWISTVEGVFKYKDHRFEQMEATNGPSKIIATSICFDHDGTLWIGTQDQGILSYKEHHIRRHTWGTGKLLGRINSIISDRNGSLWFGTDRGLVHYNHKKAELIDDHSGLTDDLVISLLQDREGNIWIGTQSGLNLYLADGFTSISSTSSPGFITQILRDTHNNLLAVAANGVYRIEDYQLKSLPFAQKTKSSHIHHVLYKSDDSLWVATNNGLFLYDVRQGKLRRIKGLDRDHFRSVFSIANDQKGNLWIGTDGGLAILTKEGLWDKSSMTGVSSQIKKITDYPLPHRSLRSLLIDHKNRIWLGFWDAGLFRFDGNHVSHYDSHDGFNSRFIRYLFEDHQGNIWIATRDKGVFRYNGKSFQNFSKENVLESNWVTSIAQDNHDRMWLGTAHGLMMYNGATWQGYHSQEELPIEDVTAVFPAGSDSIWFGTSNTLFRYVYKEGTTKQLKSTVYIKNVTRENKQVTNFPLIPHSSDLHELTWFLNTTLSRPKSISLPYLHNELSIEIAGVHYQNNSDIRYAYKLVGFDSSWSVPAQRSFVSYRNLPPGSYRFQARTNVDGKWSPEAASFSFTILTPYWKQIWFLALIIVLGILLIAAITSAINRYRYRQILKIAEIRSDIASDLHDDIGSALSSISIYSELARREVDVHPHRAAHFSGRVENISRNLMDAMNDIIWSINPGNETLQDAILRMEEFAVEMLEAKGMEVFLSIPDNVHKTTLNLESRRNLLLIFKEIVNNTARHSEATSVNITMSITPKGSPSRKSAGTLQIVVEDNGKGFDLLTQNNGNGLRNIRKRSGDIGGKLTVASSIGKGTKTELRLPFKS